MASTIVALEQEYDKLVVNLQGINQSLVKITGNPPVRNVDNKEFKKPAYYDKINIIPEEGFSEEEGEQPVLNSTIVQVQKPIKSREELSNKQNSMLNARNKRMFGHLLGTLNQFKKESDNVKEKQKAVLRHEIEKKLEEKASNEREVLIQEKRSLYTQKNYAKNKLKLLHLKIDILKMQEAWEEYQIQLKNYIKTTTYPYIYFLPKIMTPKLQIKHEECAKAIDNDIFERRELVENELKKLDEINDGNENMDIELTQEVNNNILVNNDHLGNNQDFQVSNFSPGRTVILSEETPLFDNDGVDNIEQTKLPSSIKIANSIADKKNDNSVKTSSKHIEIKCDFGDGNPNFKLDAVNLGARRRSVILGRNNNLIAFQAKRDLEKKIKDLEKRKIAIPAPKRTSSKSPSSYKHLKKGDDAKAKPETIRPTGIGGSNNLSKELEDPEINLNIS